MRTSEDEDESSAMESVFSGFVLDPAKCSQLSLGEKRELVHEIAQWAKDAPEILRSWSRPELLEIICAEMGKKRKYTGFTKSRMIEHLLKLVQEKSGIKYSDIILPRSPVKTYSGSKRQRRKEHTLQLFNDSDYDTEENDIEEQIYTLVCPNLACKANLTPQDSFCKRCSCCICYQYEDNKDPSLWLTCKSDSLNQDNSCGMSCHLKCALKHEKAGIVKKGCYTKLDGGFYCVSCGKVNDFMRSWRKQLIFARDARRVDVLCDRISLSHKMLQKTERYKEQQKIVGTAVKKLKKEVGSLDRVCSKMEREIVNSLLCGPEVQKLCSYAIESIDSMLASTNLVRSNPQNQPSCSIRFEQASAVSVVIVLEYEGNQFEDFVGCRLWHRKSTVANYPERPTYIVLRPQKKFPISELDPSTEYFFKLSIFSSTRVLGIWEAKYITEAALNGSSISGLYEEHEKEEKPSLVQSNNSQRYSTNSSDNHSKLRFLIDINKIDEYHLEHHPVDIAPLVGSTSIPPSPTQEIPSSGDKKQMTESSYEYCVKVIRWLEREGHLEKGFRVKFLTWFSLKSTVRERRVVSAFVDTLIDDPTSLAGQLVHTFSDEICIEPKPVLPKGFCTRLWH